MSKCAEMTEMEKLRHFARVSGECAESVWNNLTRAECLRVFDAWMASGWDFYPDQWTPAQLTDAIRYGIAPAWTGDEKPITYEARPGEISDLLKPKPKIFVFCNQKGCTGAGDWHSMLALAEDGTGLAGHLCSSHGWAIHDMGISEDGWKREIYAKHYPDGFDVEWVQDPDTHEGLKAAIAKAKDAEPVQA